MKGKGNMENTVWKYPVQSKVYGTWKEYGNYNMSLLMLKETGLRNSNTRSHIYNLALLMFVP